MHDQKFTYTLSLKDRVDIYVSRNVLTATRIFADGEGVSFVAATYLITKTSIETLLREEKEQKPGKKLPG